jgi:hypothetical protein
MHGLSMGIVIGSMRNQAKALIKGRSLIPSVLWIVIRIQGRGQILSEGRGWRLFRSRETGPRRDKVP